MPEIERTVVTGWGDIHGLVASKHVYSESKGYVSAVFQSRTQRNRLRPRAFAVVAVVCVVLLALLAVAQVAHTHQGVTDADHCPLCMVMHTAAPVLTAAALVALVQIAIAAPVPEVRAISRNWHSQLFTRPPPMGF